MEVKATDLRIGNLINTTGLIKTGKVMGIMGNYVLVQVSVTHVGVTSKHELSMAFDSIQGIPLSCEVLEKCGFVNVTHDRWELKISGKKRFVLHEVGLDNRRFVFVPRYGGIKGGIDYVHHLMNAYYILTGEELIVNL